MMSDPITTPETAATRGPGRPSRAELDAREIALAEREEALRERELAVAEKNLKFREMDMERAETAVAAARSGSARTGDVRHQMTEPVRGRRYHAGDLPQADDFIPPEDIPAGISYQWNTHSIFGQTAPASYTARMGMQGWQPVPTSRHPYLMPEGTPGTSPIIVGGNILVERPIELTREALYEEREKAYDVVRAKQEQLYGPAPAGQFPRARANGDNRGMVEINRSIEPGQPVQRNYQYENAGGLPVE